MYYGVLKKKVTDFITCMSVTLHLLFLKIGKYEYFIFLLYALNSLNLDK